MESKKNIGNLFRENLKQLDYTPSSKVWEQIDLDLEKREQKRRFFLWFFFGAILSGLLIGGGYTHLSDTKSITKEVKENSLSTGKTESDSMFATQDEEDKNNPLKKSIVVGNSEESIVEQNPQTQSSEQKNSTNSLGKQQKTTSNKTQTNLKKKTVAYKKKLSSKNEDIVEMSSSYVKNQTKPSRTNSELTKKSAFNTSTEIENKTSISNREALIEVTKQSAIDSLIAAISEVEKNNKKETQEKDSLPLEKTEIETKEKENELVIAPYYGLNYGSYFGEFNALSNNRIIEKDSETNAAYGILIRWMFGNKLGIQIGAGKINSRYSTTVEKTGSSFINNQNVEIEQSLSELNAMFANETKVKLTLESTYFEVPLEAYFVLRDKKIGLATTFGLSILIEDKNSVFAESEFVQKMRIGTLTTLAPTSSTLNAKVNLFYKITPSLQVDLYPTFQYQVMGHTDSSNYSNFFLSVRTGLSYKF